jgi:hypothetical protein
MSQYEVTIDGEKYPIIHFFTHIKLGRKAYRYLLTELDNDGNTVSVKLSDVVSFERTKYNVESGSRWSITTSDGRDISYSLFSSSNFVVFEVRLCPNLRDGELIEVHDVKGVRERFVYSAWYEGWIPISRRGLLITTDHLMENYVVTDILFDGLDEPLANDDDFEIKR